MVVATKPFALEEEPEFSEEEIPSEECPSEEDIEETPSNEPEI